MKLTRVFVLAFAASCLTVAAQAVVLDFEDVTTDQFGNPIPSGGFSFDFDTQGWGIFTNGFTSFNRVQNGTTTLAFSGDTQISGGNGFVLFKPQDDSAFSLEGFDSAVFHGPLGNGGIVVTGFYEAGGSTSQVFTITNQWQSFNLNASFVGLDRVEVRDALAGSFNVIPGVQLDNLRYNAVPEPATLAALGFGAAALMRRRRK